MANDKRRRGENHPAWKGGLPHCVDCNKELSRRDAKRCSSCYDKIRVGPNKGLRVQTNTGRTHFKKGQVSWNKGKKATPELRLKLRMSHLGKQVGENHPRWTGDEASYATLHKWVANKFQKTGTCSQCGETGLTGSQIHWANLSHEYKRDRSDWAEMCATCHMRYDRAKGWGAARKRFSEKG